MSEFDSIIIAALLDVFIIIISSILTRKEKSRQHHIATVCLVSVLLFGVCSIPRVYEWESDILHVQSETVLDVDIDTCKIVQDSGYIYADISFGSSFRSGDQMYVGGHYVELPSGKGAYVYKSQMGD